MSSLAWWKRRRGTGLANETDFLDLYRTLGVRPGCSLIDLKQAYRRHVARLHPDRMGGEVGDPVVAERLQRLTALYGAAMEFQREHGRLPGATLRVRFAVPEVTTQAARTTPLPAKRRAPRRVGLSVLALAAAMAVLAWDYMSSPASSPAPPVGATAGNETPLGTRITVPTLELGMSSEQVRAIVGEPTGLHGDRWEYGPSWVRFEDDQVVDWYSSPLRSLGTAGRTPDAAPSTPTASND
jgi:hypothetical protein